VHVDAEVLQITEDYLRHGPTCAELLLILPGPVRPGFVRKLRRKIQPGAREIQHMGRRDHGHLQHPQAVVTAEKLRNFKPTKFRHAEPGQPFIDRPFPQIGLAVKVRLERSGREFRVAFGQPDDTWIPTPKRPINRNW